MKREMPSIQFVSPNWTEKELQVGLPSLLDAGLKCFQLRLKNKSEAEIVSTSRLAAKLCKEYNCLFVLNDYLHLWQECEADVIHLGKNDAGILEAKNILPESTIIGATCNTFEDVSHNHKLGVDYVCLGPFRFTSTKKNLSPILGLDGYKTILELCSDNQIPLPIYAIGGIEINDLESLKSVGLKHFAASSLFVGEKGVENFKKALAIFK